MSRFNRYAVKLSEAFIEAREEYKKAAEAYSKAKADYSETQRPDYFYREQFFGEKELRLSKLKAELAYSEKAVNAAFTTAWAAFQAKVKSMDAELEADMRAYYRADANSINDGVVTLLHNDIFDLNDISALIVQYKTNPTMLKVIANYATKRAEKLTEEENYSDAALYKAVAGSAVSEDKALADAWGNLKDIAHTLFGHGESGSGINTDFNLSLMASWEELANPCIESF